MLTPPPQASPPSFNTNPTITISLSSPAFYETPPWLAILFFFLTFFQVLLFFIFLFGTKHGRTALRLILPSWIFNRGWTGRVKRWWNKRRWGRYRGGRKRYESGSSGGGSEVGERRGGEGEVIQMKRVKGGQEYGALRRESREFGGGGEFGGGREDDRHRRVGGRWDPCRWV